MFDKEVVRSFKKAFNFKNDKGYYPAQLFFQGYKNCLNVLDLYRLVEINGRNKTKKSEQKEFFENFFNLLNNLPTSKKCYYCKASPIYLFYCNDNIKIADNKLVCKVCKERIELNEPKKNRFIPLNFGSLLFILDLKSKNRHATSRQFFDYLFEIYQINELLNQIYSERRAEQPKLKK